jgi:hypothetical protein
MEIKKERTKKLGIRGIKKSKQHQEDKRSCISPSRSESSGGSPTPSACLLGLGMGHERAPHASAWDVACSCLGLVWCLKA